MATSSHKGMSFSGIYRDRSIRLKFLIAFMIIFALLLVQFFSSQNSLDQLESNFDDEVSKLEVVYVSKQASAAIRELIETVNSQVKNEETHYLEYIGWIFNEDFISFHDEIQAEIADLIDNIDNKIGELPQFIEEGDGAVKRSAGLNLLSSIEGINNQFSTYLDQLYTIIPSRISGDIKEKLVNFGNVAGSKVNQLIDWMYTNNTNSYFNATTNTDLALAYSQLQTAISQVGDSTVDALSEYTNVQQNIENFGSLLLSGILDFNATIFSDAGNPDLIDDNVLKPFLANIMNNLTLINEFIGGELGDLDLQIAELNQLASLAEDEINDWVRLNDALIGWTSQVDNKLNQEITKAKADVAKNIQEIKQNQEFLLIGILLASGLIIILVQLWINMQITKPVQTISKWSEQISKGDLSKTPSKEPMKRQDEIGKLHNNFWEMNIFLRDIIRAVRDSSELIAGTAHDLSSNTTEINSTAEEVSAIAQSMAKGSTTQAEVITDIVQELQLTAEIVDNVINQINHNLRIIHDLSEQTNVLALNTAIEAANAGEYGRGFGVISESIRKMASQSKKTTTEVTKDSSDILIQLRSTFSSISQKIENVASVSEETAASAEEVAASAEELTAIIEEIAARATSLSDRSYGFEEVVNKFILSPTFDQTRQTIKEIIPTEKESKSMDMETEKPEAEIPQEVSVKKIEEIDKSMEEIPTIDSEDDALKKLQGVDFDSILEDQEDDQK